MARSRYEIERWDAMLRRARQDFNVLPRQELEWLRSKLQVIAKGQLAMDQLFREIGGDVACAVCVGACCGSGRHHFTLANLLAYLVDNQLPPRADFARSCPFLGKNGCLLPVAKRPYACITFFCEHLDERLDQKQGALLRSLDQSLRAAYQAISDRYVGGSLQGLWLAMERLDGAPIFTHKRVDMVK